MRAWILGVALCAGCGDGDAPRAPEVVSASFSAGAVSPTATLSLVWSAPIEAASLDGEVYLARGEPDPALERPPPSSRDLGRLVPVVLAVDGAELELTPRRALEPESRYTLYVGPKLIAGGRQLGRSLALAVDTGGLDEAAPIVLLDAPADGAVDVPRNLRSVALRFSRPVAAALDVTLTDEAGAIVPARVAAAGDGVRLDLDAVLDEGRRYLVRAGPDVLDEGGRAVFGDPPGFMTGSELRVDPVELRALDASSSDRCVVVRFATDDPTWSQVCVGGRCVEDGPERSHEAAFAVDGSEGARIAYEARAWDETTRPAADLSADVGAPPPLALSLSEVLTRPLGPKLPQQFVELYNLDAQPIALGGLRLHTASGENVLPAATLEPGGYAVVVPSGYVPGAGGDPLPDASALLLRLVDGKLGGNGLHVGGEPVWITDAGGGVITRWGGYALPLKPGQSVTRAPGSCDVAASFAPTPSGGSTPGGP